MVESSAIFSSLLTFSHSICTSYRYHLHTIPSIAMVDRWITKNGDRVLPFSRSNLPQLRSLSTCFLSPYAKALTIASVVETTKAHVMDSLVVLLISFELP